MVFKIYLKPGDGLFLSHLFSLPMRQFIMEKAWTHSTSVSAGCSPPPGSYGIGLWHLGSYASYGTCRKAIFISFRFLAS